MPTLLPSKSLVLSTCAAVALLALNGLVQAQSARPAENPQASDARFEAHFAKIDRNRDGTISREEAQGHANLLKQFDAIDTNHDGKLSREELKAHRDAHRQAHPARDAKRDEARGRLAERFKAADTNHDGVLSREEVKAAKMPRLERQFDAIDANRDGKLSPAELRAYGDAQRARREGKAPPPAN